MCKGDMLAPGYVRSGCRRKLGIATSLLIHLSTNLAPTFELANEALKEDLNSYISHCHSTKFLGSGMRFISPLSPPMQ